MRKILHTLALTLLFLTNSLCSEIRETSTLIPLQEACQKADINTLVLFDVDEVLMIPKDQIFRSHNKKSLQHYLDSLTEKFPKDQFLKIWSIAHIQRKAELVDPMILPILAHLKEKKVPTVALTMCGTGALGEIEYLEDWRSAELASLGIDLSYSFPEELEIQTCLPRNLDSYGLPRLKRGIIFAAGQDKGIVFSSFLSIAKLHPDTVIFVDDRAENLAGVEKVCTQLGINFLGFHYTAVEAMPKVLLDEAQAKKQFETLEIEHRWMSDQEL